MGNNKSTNNSNRDPHSSECPLDCLLKSPKNIWTCQQLMEIESHCTGSCFQICSNPNPPLNEIVLEELGSFTVTALSVAICEANLPMVKRIFKIWGADIHATVQQSLSDDETTRTVTFQGVTPLFIAALNKNLKIVRYLIKSGADVSVGVSNESEDYWSTGMTPLHAAFFLINSNSSKSSEQLKTIRCLVEAGADPSALSSKGTPVWMMGWTELYQNQPDFINNTGYCCPKAITLLIQLGLNFNQRCSTLGRTLLHHLAGPANTGDVKVVKLLLKKGADISAQDNDGLTPIMVAAIGNNQVPNMIIFKYLLEREEIPDIEKVKALEIAAAVLLSSEENDHGIVDALAFLAQARSLRQCDSYYNFLQAPVNGLLTEWITKSTYNYQEIQRRYSELNMQSILIRIRVFSSISWRAVYRYLLPYIGKQIENLNQQDQFTSATQLLEMLFQMLDHLHYINDPLFETEILIKSLDLISTLFDQSQSRPCASDEYLAVHFIQTLYRLVSLFVELLADMLSQDIIDCLSRIVSHNGKNRYDGILPHVARTAPTNQLLPITDLLLRTGANPNGADTNGDGALHHLAMRTKGEEPFDSTALILLNAGAHLDRVNNQRKTAADFWMERKNKKKMRYIYFLFWRVAAVGWMDAEQMGAELPYWLKDQNIPNKLKCLTARVIRHHKVPYVDKLPVSLQFFVGMH